MNKENPKERQGRAKPPFELIPAALLVPLARVMEYGAITKGYGVRNWRSTTINLSTYMGAMLRHTNAANDGEYLDPESGLPHIAHAAACAAIVLDAMSLGKLVDDCGLPGKGGELIRQNTKPTEQSHGNSDGNGNSDGTGDQAGKRRATATKNSRVRRHTRG